MEIALRILAFAEQHPELFDKVLSIIESLVTKHPDAAAALITRIGS